MEALISMWIRRGVALIRGQHLFEARRLLEEGRQFQGKGVNTADQAQKKFPKTQDDSRFSLPSEVFKLNCEINLPKYFLKKFLPKEVSYTCP